MQRLRDSSALITVCCNQFDDVSLCSFTHIHTLQNSPSIFSALLFPDSTSWYGEMQGAHEHKFISSIYWNVFMGEVITASSWVNSNSICKGWQMSGELSVGTQCGGEYLNIQTIIFMGLAWGPGLEGAREERSINIDSTLYLTRTVRSLTNTFNSAPN